MSIPETQLDKWSHQGSITQSSTTYNSIKNVLKAHATPYAAKRFNVFLQGSYGNNTNIYAESDVDIIIQLNDCFREDLTDLREDEKTAYKSTFREATYTHVDFKRDVLSTLIKQYGSAVMAGDKAIAIDASGSRRKADVIVAIQFRRYIKFRSSNDSSYIEGICFWNGRGEMIVNYPRQHSANLTAKHQASSERLKPMVRVFKNMRSRMIDNGLIEPGIAPSYYLECLLYNVPNEVFKSTYQKCVVNILNWYYQYNQNANNAHLICANEQYPLLRDNSNTCWTKRNCDAFVNAAVELWNN